MRARERQEACTSHRQHLSNLSAHLRAAGFINWSGGSWAITPRPSATTSDDITDPPTVDR